MKNYLRYLAIPAFLFLINNPLFATHNRAGEIIIEQVDPCSSNTVRCILKMYTKTSSEQGVNRTELEIFWGDGRSDVVPRESGASGVPLGNDVSENIYIATHTYGGPGHYVVSMTDPRRNDGILNVNPPSSGNVDFYIHTAFTLFSGQDQGCNSTPQLINRPIGYACTGEIYTHNPGAFDPDNDSLSYELIVPLHGPGMPVPNYTFPQNIPGSSDTSSLAIDPVKGTITWMVPEILGEYNIAFIIISWRDGIPIDTTIRDMQILVEKCDDNKPPIIKTIDEICVVAGELIDFEVIATDPNPGDKVKLSAAGAPFILDVSPANDAETWRPFGSPSAAHEEQPVSKRFRWQTTCEHISSQPYTVVFTAEDDFFLANNSGGLTSSKTVLIRVVGPPPLDVQAEASSNQITVTWELPYSCENAADDFFLSFSVWRKEGDGITIDSCTTGLADTGYSWLVNTLDEANGRYTYTDTNVQRGHTYCYRILARFAKRSSSGQPYNITESLASEKACIQLSRDVPLITHVTVNETASANGEVEIRWVKPRAEDLDTMLNSGPYRYELSRAVGLRDGNFQSVASFSSPTFHGLTQDNFIDQTVDLNTLNEPHHYRLAFFADSGSVLLGYAADASSVFLEIDPTDNRNDLYWRFDVPWSNYKYDIFRWNGVDWELIAEALQDTFYMDDGLVNGREYCYYVQAYGSYGLPDIPSPQINLSQEACAIPLDNVPPCPPTLNVKNICDNMERCDEADELENELDWVNPMELCTETDDVVSYNIYFSPFEGGEFVLLENVVGANDTKLFHSPDRGLAGCYAVTALDTFANESDFSNIVCVDNCPNFSLPNTFTPNGDGANDLYIPYPFCFIDNIELSIFNRWGQLVFETRDPNINWSGENLKGNDLPAGTYYYTCKVYEQRVTGTVEAPELLNGYIDLVR